MAGVRPDVGRFVPFETQDAEGAGQTNYLHTQAGGQGSGPIPRRGTLPSGRDITCVLRRSDLFCADVPVDPREFEL